MTATTDDRRRRGLALALLVALTALLLAPAVAFAPRAAAETSTLEAETVCTGGSGIYSAGGVSTRYTNNNGPTINCAMTVPAGYTGAVGVYGYGGGADANDTRRANISVSGATTQTATFVQTNTGTDFDRLLWTSSTLNAGANSVDIAAVSNSNGFHVNYLVLTTTAIPQADANDALTYCTDSGGTGTDAIGTYRGDGGITTNPVGTCEVSITDPAGADITFHFKSPSCWGETKPRVNDVQVTTLSYCDNAQHWWTYTMPSAGTYEFQFPGGNPWQSLRLYGYTITGDDPPPPPAPTVTGAANDDGDLVITWNMPGGATESRYRFDGSGTWINWSAMVPAMVEDASAPHTAEVQVANAGGWSPTASFTWTPCSVEDIGNCQPVESPADGAMSNTTPPQCVEDTIKRHCLWWDPPLPNRPVHTATFIIRDYGLAMGDLSVVDTIVGWRCAPAGGTPDEPVEGVVYWRVGDVRDFRVDCGTDWIDRFYLLGGHPPHPPGSAPTWDNVYLWWSYGTPLPGENPDTLPPGYYAPEPAPTSGPVPAPTVVYPELPLPEPTPVPDGDCDFGITDPSSWLCGLTGLIGKLLGLLRSILTLLKGLGSLLTGLFVPDLSSLQASFSELDASWDASAPGVMMGAVGDVAGPLTNLPDEPPADCQGVEVTLPLGAWSMSMHPLSTCSELTQYVLGILLPLEAAVIYLGAFFLAFRIVTKPFGLDTPGVAA